MLCGHERTSFLFPEDRVLSREKGVGAVLWVRARVRGAEAVPARGRRLCSPLPGAGPHADGRVAAGTGARADAVVVSRRVSGASVQARS